MAEPYPNPFILQRADPWIYRHTDGWYYFTASVPEYDRLELRRARTVQGLADAEARVVWRKHPSGIMGAHIWAPELHRIDDKWYLYFAAGAAEKIWDIRIYVLENASPDPLSDNWREIGQLRTNWDSFSLDATTFQHLGQRYLVWAQHHPSIRNNTNLYIAAMDSPSSIAGEQILLTRPEYEWELHTLPVNEGPAVLIRNGRVFITYSAGSVDAHYCMGLLTADEDADLLNPASWHKSPEPVFCTDASAGIFGPGHNSFTTAGDGSDLLVYHARNYPDILGDPLKDPNRHTRLQRFTWKPDGRPDFGTPLPESLVACASNDKGELT